MEEAIKIDPQDVIEINERDAEQMMFLHSYGTSQDTSPGNRLVLYCPHCEFSTVHKMSFKNHMMIHTGERPYECPECSYTCSQKEYLRKHLRIHTGEKPYECSVCPYRCRVQSSLIRHTKIHMMEKPYACLHCGRSFRHKNSMDIHMKQHADRVVYECQECEFSSHLLMGLIRHMRKHSHVRSSGECEYTITKRGIVRHLSALKNVTPFSCRHCDFTFSIKEHLFNLLNKDPLQHATEIDISESHMLVEVDMHQWKIVCKNHRVSLKRESEYVEMDGWNGNDSLGIKYVREEIVE